CNSNKCEKPRHRSCDTERQYERKHPGGAKKSPFHRAGGFHNILTLYRCIRRIKMQFWSGHQLVERSRNLIFTPVSFRSNQDDFVFEKRSVLKAMFPDERLKYGRYRYRLEGSWRTRKP